MLPLKESAEGTEIPIKVVPKSSQNKVAGTMGGRLKVCVTAAPEKGKANTKVVETLARHFGIARRHVRILSGDTAPRKQVLLGGLSRRRVEEVLGGAS